jgi:hypothetical protein
MKNVIRNLALLMVSLVAFTNVDAQEVKIIKVKQLGNKINLEYDILGEKMGQQFDVAGFYSFDGKAFLPMKSVSGDYGKGLAGGVERLMVWDAEKDAGFVNGNLTVKLTATSQSMEPTSDDFLKFIFKLESMHRLPDNKIQLDMIIENTGGKRDLKMFNGLVTITDFKNRKHDALVGQLGSVKAPERYSTPTLTFNTGDKVKASFIFERIPEYLDRAKVLDLGFEILTYDSYSLDYKKGKLQFRDLPVSEKPQTIQGNPIVKTVNSVVGPLAVAFEKPAPVPVAVVPPEIIISEPTGTTLVGGATRGGYLAQPSMQMKDKRMRSIEGEKGIEVQSKTILVKGIAKSTAGIFEVTVSNADASVATGGAFEANVKLVPGINEIVVRATDINGATTERKFNVTRKDAQAAREEPNETEELDLVFDKQGSGKNFALIIGVNEYPDSVINNLDEPISDAASLAKILVGKYTFDANNVYFLKNATRENIIDAFDMLTKKVTKKDNVIIFYAGHGYWNPETELGYWLPSDSKSSSSANWLANSTIRDYVGAIKSRHTLLIADACFSGGIFKTRKAFSDAPNSINKLYELPSRKAMTSGTLTEVPDKSVFMETLVKRLDSNTQKYITTEELFASIKPAVLNNTETVPQFGDIKGVGDEGGDFIFVLK